MGLCYVDTKCVIKPHTYKDDRTGFSCERYSHSAHQILIKIYIGVCLDYEVSPIRYACHKIFHDVN